MKKIAMVALVAAMGAGVGCQKKQGLSEVPPPPAAEPMVQQTFEPVQVAPATPVPAYTEPVPVTTMDTMPAATAGGTYTVEKGDTIFAISRKVYGSNARAKDIIAANPGIDPNKIKAGQTLNLPQ